MVQSRYSIFLAYSNTQKTIEGRAPWLVEKEERNYLSIAIEKMCITRSKKILPEEETTEEEEQNA